MLAHAPQARQGTRGTARGAGRDRDARILTRVRLVALDLDGTLVDSAPDLAHCLGEALSSVGLPRPSLADVRGWIGDGIEALIGRGFSAGLCGRPGEPAMFPLALEAFDRCYAENLYRESRIYPGVPATLDSLAAAGFVVGCVTNKRERFARELLRCAGIENRLRFLFGGDSLAAKKPDPAQLQRAAADFGITPAEGIMVGDSINDREAARRAGFGFVFAAYGYARADDPALSDGLAVIRKFGELGALLSAPQAGQ